jgi:hypothetical protein
MTHDRSESGDGRLAVAKRQAVWVRVKALSAQEKAEIAAKCGRFIADTLKPRFLPEVCPTECNYPVELLGKWRGEQFSFIPASGPASPKTLAKNSMRRSLDSTTLTSAFRRRGST